MKKSSTYTGSLAADVAAAGMNAAIQNAKRLAEDARLLLDARRFASATALAILSIEESGKVSILRGLVLARDDREQQAQWKLYRTHKAKNTAWIFPLLASQGARALDDFRGLFDKEADHPQFLDDLKQLAVYTDCLVNVHWSQPSDVIDEDMTEILVATAEIFSTARPVSPREVELWIEHIGPVWKGPLDWMKTALVKWDAAMQAEGLSARDGSPTMEEFVRGSPIGDQR